MFDAAGFVAERRARGYPDFRIRIMASVRPMVERRAIERLLDGGCEMAKKQITEVGFKKGIVHIVYEQFVGSDTQEVKVESADKPRATFFTAMGAMAIHAVRLMEIPVPEEYVVDLSVRSVKIKPKDDGSWGLTVACVKKLSTGQVLCLNTAYTEDAPSNDSAAALPLECVKAVTALVAEAEAYLDGKRAQGQLFDGKGDEKKDAPDE